MIGQPGGATGVDDDFVAAGFTGIGRHGHGPQHVRSGARPVGERSMG
jgi:hypothetical protein